MPLPPFLICQPLADWHFYLRVKAEPAASRGAAEEAGRPPFASLSSRSFQQISKRLPEATQRGISLRGLRKLRDKVKQLCSQGEIFGSHEGEDYVVKDFDELTTTRFVYGWVKRHEVTGDERLADCPDLIDPADIGVPLYFVSHAWLGSFAKLLDGIFGFLKNASDDTVVWIDCLAVNQHGDTRLDVNKADVASFEATVKACTGGTVAVMDKKRMNAASRMWCIFEWLQAIRNHGSDGLYFMGLSLIQRQDVVDAVNVETAGCFDPKDGAMILGKVREFYGSTAAFDMILKLQLLFSPLSFKVDIEQLTRRSEATQWIFGPVHEWLAEAEQQS